MKELFESSYLSLMSEENDKLKKEIERLNNIINEARYKLIIITSRSNITGDLFNELLDIAHLLGDDKDERQNL